MAYVRNVNGHYMLSGAIGIVVYILGLSQYGCMGYFDVALHTLVADCYFAKRIRVRL